MAERRSLCSSCHLLSPEQVESPFLSRGTGEIMVGILTTVWGILRMDDEVFECPGTEVRDHEHRVLKVIFKKRWAFAFTLESDTLGWGCRSYWNYAPMLITH